MPFYNSLHVEKFCTILLCADFFSKSLVFKKFFKEYDQSTNQFVYRSGLTFCQARPRGYKTFFILNSAEHDIYPAHKC